MGGMVYTDVLQLKDSYMSNSNRFEDVCKSFLDAMNDNGVYPPELIPDDEIHFFKLDLDPEEMHRGYYNLNTEMSVGYFGIKEEISYSWTFETGVKTVEDSLKAKSFSNEVDAFYMSDVEQLQMKWLWDRRIALGNMTLLFGAPAVGKSQMSAYITSVITKKGRWEDKTPCETGNVIILNAEQSPSYEIAPQLSAAGANLNRVVMIKSFFCEEHGKRTPKKFIIKRDVDAMKRVISEIKNVKLIIVDPITSYMGSGDNNSVLDVRAALEPLVDLAQEHNLSILALAHSNKTNGLDALSRVAGSQAYGALVRSALFCDMDKKTGKMYLLSAKASNCEKPPGVEYKIESVILANGIKTSKLVFTGNQIALTANQFIEENNSQKKVDAKDFIISFLRNKPKVFSHQLYMEANNQGISQRTLERGLKDLNIQCLWDENRKPYYRLPNDLVCIIN